MAGRPKGGYQLKDGTKVPGVTTITNRFKDSGGLMFWAFEQGASGADTLYEKRDEAADVGSFVHARWEAQLSGNPLPLYPATFTHEQNSQAQNGLQAANRWLEDTVLKITPVEAPLVSDLYHYGGTPDAVGLGKRGESLVDWKTGKDIYPETWMQMSAYIQLIRENSAIKRIEDGVHVIRFGKVGGEFAHLHVPLDHPGLILAWEQFQALIGCYERDKRLKKLT